MITNWMSVTRAQYEQAIQACYEAKAEIEKLIGNDCPHDPGARCNVPGTLDCKYIKCPVIFPERRG